MTTVNLSADYFFFVIFLSLFLFDFPFVSFIIFFSSNKNIQNDDVSNSINGDSGKGNSESGDCEVIFQRSERYIGSPVRFLTWDQKPEFFFNMLLRKLRFL